MDSSNIDKGHDELEPLKSVISDVCQKSQPVLEKIFHMDLSSKYNWAEGVSQKLADGDLDVEISELIYKYSNKQSNYPPEFRILSIMLLSLGLFNLGKLHRSG